MDTFTHRDRWGTTHLGVLTSIVGPLPLYKWFQFGSGVLGLAGVALWLVLWVRRAPPAPVPGRARPHIRYASWVLLLAVTALAGALTGLTRLEAGATIEAAAVGVATSAIGAGGAVLIALCAAWHLSVRH